MHSNHLMSNFHYHTKIFLLNFPLTSYLTNILFRNVKLSLLKVEYFLLFSLLIFNFIRVCEAVILVSVLARLPKSLLIILPFSRSSLSDTLDPT